MDISPQGIEPEKPPYRVSAVGSLICFVQAPERHRTELIEKPQPPSRRPGAACRAP